MSPDTPDATPTAAARSGREEGAGKLSDTGRDQARLKPDHGSPQDAGHRRIRRRIAEEIAAFDLTHLPLKVSELSAGGQSLFSVWVAPGKVRNNWILSEGERRALARPCFPAEIGGNDVRYAIVVDDPVSSLDHIRMRKVARGLVAEAVKGRQVIVFTHNLVCFNEMASEAARAGDAAPLTSRRSMISVSSASDGRKY